MKSFSIVEVGSFNSPEQREMVEHVKSEIELAKREDRPTTLAVIGVESLHIIRDLYGNGLTDEILRRVAALFERADGNTSVAGWVEGLRIVLLLSSCDLERAVQMGERVIQRAREFNLKAGNHRLHLAPNIGLAHTQHDKDYAFETLLQVAEAGTEVASSSGGGRAIHTELYEIVQPDAGPRRKREKVVTLSRRESETVVPEPDATVASVPPELISAELEELQRQLETPVEVKREQDIQSKLSAGRVHDEMLENMLREMFTDCVNGKTNRVELEEQVIGAVRRWSDEARAALVLELYQQQEQDLELLRRRLAKALRRMEAAELETDLLRANEPAAEGIESAFRSVQGLSARDAQFKVKSGMMYDIMRANLELMRRIH